MCIYKVTSITVGYFAPGSSDLDICHFNLFALGFGKRYLYASYVKIQIARDFRVTPRNQGHALDAA